MYSTVYVPGAASGATVMVPSSFTVNTSVGVEVRITSSKVTGSPFRVSLESTLLSGTTPPAVSETKESSTASITLPLPGSTTTLTVAVSQLLPLAISQMVYSTVYVPGAASGATVMVPSSFTVNTLVGVEVKITSSKVTGSPFRVSLESTLLSGIIPPAVSET